MNKPFIYNLSIFIGICFLVYLVFKNINFSKEGMEMPDTSSVSSSVSSTNGIAGGAAAYAANIKAQAIKIQDSILISKYRADYENVIINMDDLINNIMVQTTLSIDQTKPEVGLEKLTKLYQAKTALNSVMKFVDKV